MSAKMDFSKLGKRALVREVNKYCGIAQEWEQYFYFILKELRKADKKNEVFKSVEDPILTIIDKQIRRENRDVQGKQSVS